MSMSEATEFIPDAGACLTTKSVLDGTGRVRWMVRDESTGPADNGWRIFSDIDTEDDLADASNFQIADYNDLCAIEPTLIGIWDFAVGSDLQIVDEGDGIRIFDTPSGREIPPENFYVPPRMRAAQGSEDD